MAPAIVLLHYFGGSSESWQYVRKYLPDDRQVVTFDLPGFGRSPMIPDPSIRDYSIWVWEQLKLRSIGRFVLVGHSMGGKIAMDMASMQSSASTEIPRTCRLQGLGLIAPSPATREPMPESKKDKLEATHPSVTAAQEMIDESAVIPLSERRRLLAVQTNLMTESTAWRWWLRKGMDHSIATAASTIDVPVAILASEDDPVIPIANIRRDVVNRVPRASLTVVSSVGHLMPMEDERLVADWIVGL